MRAVYVFLLVCCLSGCDGGDDGEGGSTPPVSEPDVLKIPVVVHVLYELDSVESNISIEKIRSQIDVLNLDFRALNDDISSVPSEFSQYVADVGIKFYLASLDPQGAPTTAITRTVNQTVNMDDVFFTNSGGKDAWPTDRYLNIWINDGADRNGKVSAPGRAQFPGGDPLTDGIVIAYQAFGTLPPLALNLHKGRTTTHEIGHWLDLRHIYAEPGNCNSSDFIDDTPSALNPYTGHPLHPVSSCGSNDMFMNFMDRASDDVLVMFTKGQKARMRAVLGEYGQRSGLVR